MMWCLRPVADLAFHMHVTEAPLSERVLLMGQAAASAFSKVV
jgi:hypothetical protein